MLIETDESKLKYKKTELAQLLGISRPTLDKYLKDGTIPLKKLRFSEQKNNFEDKEIRIIELEANKQKYLLYIKRIDEELEMLKED